MKKLLAFLFALVAVSSLAANVNFRIRRHVVRAPETFIFTSDVQIDSVFPSMVRNAQLIANFINAHKPGYVLNGGDFTQNRAVNDSFNTTGVLTGPEDFKEFDNDAWASVISSLGKDNLYGVAGNHDSWTDATWAFAHKDYCFVHDGIFFLMLNVVGDSNSDQPTWDIAWTEKVLDSQEAKRADFRIAIFHEPGDTNRDGGWTTSLMAQTIRTQLYPLFEKYGVDLILNGHIHTYRKWMENGILHIISGGGGAGFQGDSGDIVNSSNFHNFIEFRKEFDGATGNWRLSAKVIGLDEINPDDPKEYEIDSFDLYSK